MKFKSRNKKAIRVFVKYCLGPVLFVWLSYSIYMQIMNQPNLERSWMHIRESMNGPMIWNLVAVVLLMLVNWSIETRKWQVAVRSVQQVGFIKAFKAVLSGVSFSVTTPNRVGEYLGRVLYMEDGNRMRAISLTIICSLSQLLVTLYMGLAGLVILDTDIGSSHILEDPWRSVFLYGTLIMTVVLTLFYCRLSPLVRWLDRLPGSARYAWLIQAIETFNATILLQLLSLSAIRFFVFVVQYYLLFRLFDVNISLWEGWWAVSVSFLVLAIIPTIALFTDLGLRGVVTWKLLGLFTVNQLGVSLTTVSIWFINLIIPALAGSLLILSIKKIFRTKEETIEPLKEKE